MPDDPFTVLGLAPGASAADAAEAYRALAQIYHPDRYAQAPERVRLEATRRMQAVNEAYAQVRARATASRPGPEAASPPPQPPPPAQQAEAVVHYVDGARGFHNGDVAPLGYVRVGEQMEPVPGAPRCARLDDELRAWFEQQRRNASRVSQQLYATWDEDQQLLYAATLGCSQVPAGKARALGVPCGVCRP